MNISITTVSAPVKPFNSHGDLWFCTCDDNNNLFSAWGDGFGLVDDICLENNEYCHHGLIRIKGTFPDVKAELITRNMPFSEPEYNSKPSSMLFLDGRLYAAIHHPLCLPQQGIIAYSDDQGETFHYHSETNFTLLNNNRFICLMFINMGRNYELNSDGYVYAFGTDSEVHQSHFAWRKAPAKEMKVYLARMPKDRILDYSSWTYFRGADEKHTPCWSGNWFDSVPIMGLSEKPRNDVWPDIPMLFSAMYHPGLKLYLTLTATISQGKLLYSEHPWGPWKSAGKWFEKGDGTAWYPSYMPALIPKDTGANSFYFVASAQLGMWVAPPEDPHGHMREEFARNYHFRIGEITVSQK